MSLRFLIEHAQETDGRWIAEIRSLPGVTQYGDSKEEATRNVVKLALEVLADKIMHNDLNGEPLKIVTSMFAVAVPNAPWHRNWRAPKWQ